MTANSPPINAIFFDIGGVCAGSPMLAIAEYELANNIPTGYINFAIVASAPTGAWQLLERAETPLNSAFYNAFARDICSPMSWRSFHAARHIPLPSPHPPFKIDAERLFWNMMERGRTLDPVMMKAVDKLRSVGKEKGWKVGALTNDYRYPDRHPFLRGKPELRGRFDVWIASSECGMRKPEEEVYRFAMEKAGVEDGRGVVFCDDIGANLKGAARLGWRGIKVAIGGVREAVGELERLTGVELLDEGERSRL
ncbi:epoxide hydrolase [Trichophaea hybrida]|nr:epoxide hydrolase [Trichophaea hybrida]